MAESKREGRQSTREFDKLKSELYAVKSSKGERTDQIQELRCYMTMVEFFSKRLHLGAQELYYQINSNASSDEEQMNLLYALAHAGAADTRFKTAHHEIERLMNQVDERTNNY